MSEWISVNEKLPEEGVKVLSFGNGKILVDYLVICNEPFWAYRKIREKMEVTHWMPLPIPPKRRDNE